MANNPNRISRSPAYDPSVGLQAFATDTKPAAPPDSEINCCFGGVDAALTQIELLSLEMRSRLSPVQFPSGPANKDSGGATAGPASQFGQALDNFRLRIEAVSAEIQDQLNRLAI